MAGEKTAQMKGLLAKAIKKIKTNRKLEIGVYIGIGALVILLYISSVTGGEGTTRKTRETEPQQSVVQSERETEVRLEQALSSIRGAGRVKVMITYETGAELVPAMNTDISSDRSETNANDRQSIDVRENETTRPATVSANGNNAPIVLTEKQPTVRGVIVMAEGAADIGVKLDLQRAVAAVLAVPLSNIEIFELARETQK